MGFKPSGGARMLRAFTLTLTAWAFVGEATACDICAIYTATVMGEHRTGPWVGVAEQFTSFNTLRDGDETIDNPAGEWLQSSITQFVLGYALHPRFGIQLSVPIISREYRRMHEGEIERGDERGVGDASFLGRFNAFELVSDDSVVRLDLLGGIKLPTGDSDRLGEERADADDGAIRGDASRLSTRDRRSNHDGEDHDVSGVHGHDLALGTGSIDGVFGLALFSSWERAFFEATLQYYLRGDGDSDYTYANDLVWSGGPGAYAWLGHKHTLALQAALSGESKGKDTQDDERLDDTAITSLYLGPRLLATFEEHFHGDLGVEWPLVQNVTSVQIVPDWRMRLGLAWRF